MKSHHYQTSIEWTGNNGQGTSSYTSYERNHHIKIEGKADILASSDPSFRGDATRHNPEELLVASISSCHMLWYLHLCATEGIIVTEYHDEAEGEMIEQSNGSGVFKQITLTPRVSITDATLLEKALALHVTANKFCFIANSVNFPVLHKPVIKVG